MECWGDDEYGQVSNTTTTEVSSVTSGKLYSCSVNMDSSIGCWGIDNGQQAGGATSWDYGQVSNAPVSQGYVEVNAGLRHACSLDELGQIECWGIDIGNSIDKGQVTETPIWNIYTS